LDLFFALISLVFNAHNDFIKLHSVVVLHHARMVKFILHFPARVAEEEGCENYEASDVCKLVKDPY
jgi:hypothetical protein